MQFAAKCGQSFRNRNRSIGIALLALVLPFLLPSAGRATQPCPQTKLLASDGHCGGAFGASVAMEGDVIAVGSPEDIAVLKQPGPGAVYVFRRQNGQWVEEQKLAPLELSDGDQFGARVSLSGTRIIAGAFQQSNADYLSGAAYVFRWNGSQWVLEQKLLPSDPLPLGHFGLTVAIDGDVAAISSFPEVFGGSNEPGAVYVFRYNGASWVEQQKLTASDGVPYSLLARSLAMKGGTIVAAGAGAYVFRWNGMVWFEEQKLTPADAPDGYGSSCALFNDVVVVGADSDDAPHNGSGSAYVFRYHAPTWIQEQKLLPSDPQTYLGFGQSVSLELGLLVVGAPGATVESQVSSGAIYVFRRGSAGWTQQARLTATDAGENDTLGNSIDLDGCVVISGAYGDNDACPQDPYGTSGAAYFFDAQVCLNCIPALSTVGICAMGLLLLIVGAAVLRRRQEKSLESTPLSLEMNDVFQEISSSGSVDVHPPPSVKALETRTPLPKPASAPLPAEPSELHVKFLDYLKVRAVGGSVASEVSADLSAVLAVKNQYALTFFPSTNLTQAELDFLETRGGQISGDAQPDLAGIVLVSGPAETIQAAADALLALSETEFVEFAELDPPPPSCADIPPFTYNMFYGFTYHHQDPGVNMTCAWLYGGRGEGVQVTDCEYSFRRLSNPSAPIHEDLCDVLTHQSSACLHHTSPTVGLARNNHGLAVLGMLFAEDNLYGWKGLVPNATARFSSESTQTSCGSTRTNAITLAALHSQPGDIILLEMESAGPGNMLVPAEVASVVWVVTKNVTDQGIIVVAAAGNGNGGLIGENLDRTDLQIYNTYRNRGDSGAIVVGAGTNDTSHERISFSTYGQRVNVQGWGQSVSTLGYGDGEIADPPDPLQSYTNNFNGTSSASAMVAGAAAAIQSIRLAHQQPKLTPIQMRDLLVSTGIPQGPYSSAQHIGPFPNLAKAILQLGIGAVDCEANGVPDECETRGACCVGTSCSVTTCSITTAACCVNQGGTPYEPGTTCQDCDNNAIADVCESPFGACCVDTACTVGFQTCCTVAGGVFKGANTDCQDCNGNEISEVCEALVGACCISQTCALETETCCNAAGGAFRGLNTNCQDCGPNGVPDQCESPVRCCVPGESCSILTADCCAAIGGYVVSKCQLCPM